MRARKSDGGSLVYSTAPTPAPARPATPKPTSDGIVRIWLERKGRNGTPASIIRGLPNDRDALLALAGRLKRACGTGGSAKDGEIIIQGDHRERLAELLASDGLRVKLAGG
jgi:translation initiation factor 1